MNLSAKADTCWVSLLFRSDGIRHRSRAPLCPTDVAKLLGVRIPFQLEAVRRHSDVRFGQKQTITQTVPMSDPIPPESLLRSQREPQAIDLERETRPAPRACPFALRSSEQRLRRCQDPNKPSKGPSSGRQQLSADSSTWESGHAALTNIRRDRVRGRAPDVESRNRRAGSHVSFQGRKSD